MLFNWDIVGHKKQIQNLEREIQEDNIAHAYLFYGPRQTGKFSLAKQFANTLQKETNPDRIVICDDGESIKIDEMRELIRKTNLTHQGKYRIVLIQNVERMPIEAQNSFLKTLEEPPGKTIFIMTAYNLDQVLPTIQSRVRQYYFPNIPDSTLRDYLGKRFESKEHLDEVINIAQGRPGLAIDLMQDSTALASQRTLYNQIETFLKKNDLSQKIAYVENLAKETDQIEVFIDAFMRYLRKLIYEYMHLPNHALKGRFSFESLVNLFEYLEKTRYLLRRNVNKRLVLENLMIQTEK